MLPGAKLDREIWQSIRTYYKRSQILEGTDRGAWEYLYRGDKKVSGPRLAMTTAGLCGLLITDMNLKGGREKPRDNGTWQNCGDYGDNRPESMALDWIALHLPSAKQWENQRQPYYCLFGLEWAGRLSGLRFIGSHNWYRDGC